MAKYASVLFKSLFATLAWESEEEPWQSNKGVSQQLNRFRSHFATRRSECLVSMAFVRNAPSKEEIGAGVKKREDKAKDDRLEEMPGAPVLSPIFDLPPQDSQSETLALIQLLKWTVIVLSYPTVGFQQFPTNLRCDLTSLVFLNTVHRRRQGPCYRVPAWL